MCTCVTCVCSLYVPMEMYALRIHKWYAIIYETYEDDIPRRQHFEFIHQRDQNCIERSM